MQNEAIKPWAHQLDYAVSHALDRQHILLWEPRVGKSLAIAMGFERWFAETPVRRIVVVAPKTVCESVWPGVLEAIPGRCEAARGFEVINLYSGTLESRKDALRALFGHENPQVALVNREALEPLEPTIIKWKPLGLVLDELHDYKTPSAARSHAAYRISRLCYFRRGLTGTPVPNGFRDLYGQWKIIAPAIFGTNRAKFDERYVIFNRFNPHLIQEFQNLDELRSKAFSIASIVFRKDCFDIPDEQDIDRVLELPANVRKMYDKIIREHVLALETSNEPIPLRHTLSRLGVLRQLATGYVRLGTEEDGDKRVQWEHTVKLDSVRDEAIDILESGQKVVIFHVNMPEGDEIARMLKAYHPLLLRGTTEGRTRAENLERFATNENYPLIIVQEQVGSLGISLAAAQYTIFLSTGYGHDTHKQARDRTFKPASPGNKTKLVYIYPTMGKTVDVFVRRLLINKNITEQTLLKGGVQQRTKAFTLAAYGEL